MNRQLSAPAKEYKRPIKIWGQKLQPQMRYIFHIKLGEKFKLANEKRYILMLEVKIVFFLVDRGNMNQKS